MKSVIFSIQIHASYSSYSSLDIFMELAIEEDQAKAKEEELLKLSFINFRGCDSYKDTTGYFFEDKTYDTLEYTDANSYASPEQMKERTDFFTSMGFILPINEDITDTTEEVAVSDLDKIKSLVTEIEIELEEGWTFKCRELEELINIIYHNNKITILPNKKYNEKILTTCKEIVYQFENGMDGIREVEELVTDITKSFEV